ncbi:MAG: putative baseplate assembly protein, partial [Steroidobacteraceae bacterium]
MRRLAPDFFDRRFDDLLEAGRSRLPSLAPRWTDYNAHDPGITLMELLAWVSEAQLYSLARMRRDERAAYAALLGLR